MTKTINGRVYSHRTKENPPRYARRSDRFYPELDEWFILNYTTTGEDVGHYFNNSLRPASHDPELIPIPDEPKPVEYLEGWVNVYENRFGDRIFQTESNAKENIVELPSDYGRYIKTINIKYPKAKI